jgi:hypothetical protein
MTAKSIITLEVEKNGNVYTFHMPYGVNYGEAYDAAFAILEDILTLSKQAVEAARREKKDDEVSAS